MAEKTSCHAVGGTSTGAAKEAQSSGSTKPIDQSLEKAMIFPVNESNDPNEATSSFGVYDLDSSEEETRFVEMKEMFRTHCQIKRDPRYGPSALLNVHQQQSTQQIGGYVCPDVALLDSASSMNEVTAGTGSIKYGPSWISECDTDDYDKENQGVYRETENYGGMVSENEFGYIYPSPAFSEDEMQSSGVYGYS